MEISQERIEQLCMAVMGFAVAYVAVTLMVDFQFSYAMLKARVHELEDGLAIAHNRTDGIIAKMKQPTD